MKDIELRIKRLELKVNEVYEWMELTQNKTIEKLSNQIKSLKKDINKLEYEK